MDGVQFVYTIIVQAGRFVVGGATGEDEVAVVWTRDGDSGWTRRDLLVDGGAHGAAAGPAGFVLVGEANRHSGYRPAIWHSADGLAWERVGPGRESGEFGSFSDVVSTESGFLAFGQIGSSPIPELGSYPLPEEARYEGAPWTSSDGVTWHVVTDRTPFAWAHVAAIVAGQERLVAVGWVRNRDTGARTAAVWTSIDGLSWTRVQLPGTPPPVHFDLAAEDGSGRIAAWSAADFEGGAWWLSDDGRQWELVSDPLFSAVTVNAVTTFGAGLVAVGQAPAGSCPIWVSPGS